jgi:hypothetical protein
LDDFEQLLERWGLTEWAPRRLDVSAARGALALGEAVQ